MPASCTLESLAPPEIRVLQVIRERHQQSRERRGTQDRLVHLDRQANREGTALMAKQERQAPQAVKEIPDQINLPPLPLRLQALLPLSSLLSLRKLWRLLLRRLRLVLRVLRNKRATHRAPQVNPAVRGQRRPWIQRRDRKYWS